MSAAAEAGEGAAWVMTDGLTWGRVLKGNSLEEVMFELQDFRNDTLSGQMLLFLFPSPGTSPSPLS